MLFGFFLKLYSCKCLGGALELLLCAHFGVTNTGVGHAWLWFVQIFVLELEVN